MARQTERSCFLHAALAGLTMDLRLAWRGLRRRRAFFCLVVGVLACGLGSGMAGFGMYEASVLKPVPYPEPDRLIQMAIAHQSRPLEAEAFYRQDLLRVAERTDLFAATGSFRTGAASLSDGSRPERVDIGIVSPSLFPMLGVQPALGRGFEPADALPGAPSVVLLSDMLWRQRYAADPEIVGRAIRIDLRPRTVIGIMPPGFAFPYRERLWLPLMIVTDGDATDTSRAIGVARLADGVSLVSAEGALGSILDDAVRRHPDRYRGYRLRLQPLSWFFVDWQARDGQRLLLIAVMALLLLALVNVAGLMLAHSRDREAEWQVRTAIGAAGGGRLLGGLAAGVVVAATALALALPLARAGLVWMEGQIWQSEDPSPYFLRFDLTPGTVGVGMMAALVAALFAGVLPMLMPGTGRGPAVPAAFTRTTGSRAAARLAGGLVATQVALSLTIMVVMGVLGQAVQAMGHRDVGARRMDLLTARLSLPAERYPTAEARERFWITLVERLRQAPGILDATAGTAVPGFRGDDETVRVEGGESGRDLLRVSTGTVDEHFLTAYGIHLNEGRDFTDRDAAAPVAIIDRRFADAAWPGREAVGRRLRIDSRGDAWSEVVGVVDNLHLAQVDDPPRASALLYLGNVRPSSSFVAVGTTGRPTDALSALQGVVTSMDPDLPLYSIYSLDDAISHGHANVRIAVKVLAWLGICGLLVAAAGLYAMLAVRVTERTREIGVRRAVGASTVRVARAVLHQAVVPLVAGGLAGFALAFPVASSLVALEPSVMSMGPASFGGAALVLAIAAAVAIVAPLTRAIAIDPMAALREE